MLRFCCDRVGAVLIELKIVRAIFIAVLTWN